MNLLLILMSFLTSNLKGYIAVGIPSGETRNLLKGGGTVGFDATIYQCRFLAAGISIEGSSFVMSGSGNSEIKLASIAPLITLVPPLLRNIFSFEGRPLFTRFQIQNPSYTNVYYITGYSLGTDIKITDKPLKLYISVNYSNYRGIDKKFSFYNLGFALRM